MSAWAAIYAVDAEQAVALVREIHATGIVEAFPLTEETGGWVVMVWASPTERHSERLARNGIPDGRHVVAWWNVLRERRREPRTP